MDTLTLKQSVTRKPANESAYRTFEWQVKADYEEIVEYEIGVPDQTSGDTNFRVELGPIEAPILILARNRTGQELQVVMNCNDIYTMKPEESGKGAPYMQLWFGPGSCSPLTDLKFRTKTTQDGQGYIDVLIVG